MKKIILYMVTGILMINIVAGLGVGPAYTHIDFEPELERQFTINIYNSDNQDLSLLLEAEGDLGKYIQLSSQTLSMNSTDNSKPVSFTISLPKSIEPGTYTGKLKITQLPSGEPGTITATIGVSHTITLEVPVHGKYISANIDVREKDINATIRNIGLNEIGEVIVNNTITGYGEPFSTVKTISNLKSDEERSLLFDKPLQNGEYLNILQITYDGLNKTLEKSFMSGEKKVEITGLEFKDFRLGNINRIETNLFADWNREITTRVEIDIISSEGDKIGTLTSSDKGIKGEGTAEVFWETQGLSEGEYTFRAKTIIEGRISSQKKFVFDITENSIMEKKPLKLPAGTLILAGAIIILLTVLITQLRHLKKKRI